MGVGITEMSQAIVYMKYDRSRACSVKPGDTLPDAPLVDLEGNPSSLYAHIAPDRPTIIVCGSGS
jgi:hypothetical protein